MLRVIKYIPLAFAAALVLVIYHFVQGQLQVFTLGMLAGCAIAFMIYDAIGDR